MGKIRNIEFRPAWWASGCHAQTLWPTFFRQRRPPQLRRERLELADGDFLDLELTDRGGHVGFVSGTLPWRAHYWAEARALAWLSERL
jgi:predicted alpha/beta-fold hydrolase